MKVSVFGLGRAGLPLSAVIADSGFEVVGVDVDEEKVKKINQGINFLKDEPGLDELVSKYGGARLLATPNYKDAKECELHIVIVPLFFDENKILDFRCLESVFRNIGKILKKGDAVVLETTVPPLTTETKARKWLEEESGLKLGEFYLAHSPERVMAGYCISRLREFPKIIGGVNKESGERIYQIYKKFIPNLHLVSNARTAEFIKVMEGCYRDVNIALANELFKMTEELGIDFYEAREFANHEYCHIHLPSTGVGGHCIPVYPWFLIREMEKRERYAYTRILKIAREVNDDMINYWAERIVLECMKIEKPLKDIRICVKGITFRRGVKETRFSRNLALAKLLKEKGLNVCVFDEMFNKEEIEKLGLVYAKPDDADIVFDVFDLKIIKR